MVAYSVAPAAAVAPAHPAAPVAVNSTSAAAVSKKQQHEQQRDYHQQHVEPATAMISESDDEEFLSILEGLNPSCAAGQCFD